MTWTWGLPLPRQALGENLNSVNWKPFFFGNMFTFAPYARHEILGNLLLTVPMGFGIPLLTRRSRRTIWMVLAGGIVFESAQLLISLAYGWAYRSIDINDAILNTAGALIGYGVFRGVEGMCQRVKRQISFSR